MKPTFFASASELRSWLARHHGDAAELMVGIYKRGSGRESLSWAELVDEVLCYGWIDGRMLPIDESSYAIRITPRRAGSTWSARNVSRFEELERTRRMRAAGRRAFAARRPERTGTYSHENREAAVFERDQEREFRADREAWRFFTSQPPWYRRAATWWVISAKREETKARRLATLIEDSRAERTVKHLTPRAKATRNCSRERDDSAVSER